MDGITHITTEAITTDIATKGITTGITIVGITIGTALGLSASMGVQDIIAIGKRNCARPGRFSTSSDRSAAIRLDLITPPHHDARQIKGEI